MLSLLWEAIIGLIVGAVAKLLMPGKDPGGIRRLEDLNYAQSY
jgi:uncharacterized membrane protein YeaQ/YmgE (transglycosylase-associated protein family)